MNALRDFDLVAVLLLIMIGLIIAACAGKKRRLKNLRKKEKSTNKENE